MRFVGAVEWGGGVSLPKRAEQSSILVCGFLAHVTLSPFFEVADDS